MPPRLVDRVRDAIAEEGRVGEPREFVVECTMLRLLLRGAALRERRVGLGDPLLERALHLLEGEPAVGVLLEDGVHVPEIARGLLDLHLHFLALTERAMQWRRGRGRRAAFAAALACHEGVSIGMGISGTPPDYGGTTPNE